MFLRLEIVIISIACMTHVLAYSSCADVTTSGLYTFEVENVYTKQMEKFETYCQMELYNGNWTLIGRTWPSDGTSHTFPFGWNVSFHADQFVDSESYSLGITRYLTQNWTTSEILLIVGTRSLNITNITEAGALYGKLGGGYTLNNLEGFPWVNYNRLTTHLVGNCTDIPTMLSWMGDTGSTDHFLFRDMGSPGPYGLYQDGWSILGPGSCGYDGFWTTQLGSLWVRLPPTGPRISPSVITSSEGTIASSPSLNLGMIIGISVGGFALLIIISVIIIVLTIKQKQKVQQSPQICLKVVGDDIYSPMSSTPKDHLSITVNDNIITKVTLGPSIGKGNFGQVYKGTWDKLEVAIKSVTDEQRSVLERESEVMRSLNHPRIIRYFGMCFIKNVKYMVLEYASEGALLDYVQEHEGKIPKQNYVDWTQDLAAGMCYLMQQRIIHKDLALRNILLRKEEDRIVAKVADFGLSTYGNEYYKSEGDNIPIRWCAPECLLKGKFSSATDVWAFAVTLWELYSDGNRPYLGMKNSEVANFVAQEKKTLDPPQNCPLQIQNLMRACWRWDANQRPTFDDIVKQVDHL